MASLDAISRNHNFSDCLRNIKDHVKLVKLVKPGYRAGRAAYETSPRSQPQDWTAFYDPLYGVCQSLSLANLSRGNMVRHMAFQLNMGASGTTSTWRSSYSGAHYALHRERVRSGSPDSRGALQILAFKSSSFMSTHAGFMVHRGSSKSLSLSLERLDKCGVVSGGSRDPHESEDQCLRRCLVNKSAEAFECVHPRVSASLLGIKEGEAEDTKICNYTHLRHGTEELLKKANRSLSGLNITDEVGWVKIQEWVSSFHDSIGGERTLKDRCMCAFPCAEDVFRFQLEDKFKTGYNEARAWITVKTVLDH